jgi:hypothetical protein
MKYFQIICVFIALVLWFTMPVMGVTTYLGGSPLMSAAISGTNEFTPGQDATIKLIVWNSGVNDLKFVTTGTIGRDDLPTTAKMVTLGLSAGNAPVVVKNDPQLVGDIASQGIATVSIETKITSDATEGEYQLPLNIQYTYLASSSQEAADVLQYNYQKVDETIPITIKIKPQVKIEILDAVSENLNIGSEGYLNLTIKNVGLEDGKKASVKILRNGASPIIPTDNSVFIGDFPHNSTVTCRYKVAVSEDAEIQSYPVDVLVMYENRDGDVVSSTTDTVGIPVGGKLSFTITSGTVQVIQGSQSVIRIVYKNTGTRPAYNAQARLSAVEPFKSSDDTAYLGDIKPGENVTAQYQVQVDDAAIIKNYTLDTEVRYRDALDNSQVSDPFRVAIEVQPRPSSGGSIQVLGIIGIIVLIVGVGAGYYLLVMRKKK